MYKLAQFQLCKEMRNNYILTKYLLPTFFHGTYSNFRDFHDCNLATTKKLKIVTVKIYKAKFNTSAQNLLLAYKFQFIRVDNTARGRSLSYAF